MTDLEAIEALDRVEHQLAAIATNLTAVDYAALQLQTVYLECRDRPDDPHARRIAAMMLAGLKEYWRQQADERRK